nr:response regulator transcription factor [Nitrospirota bacterium]
IIAAGFLGSIAGEVFGFAKAAPRQDEETPSQTCGATIYLKRTPACLAATGFLFPRTQSIGLTMPESTDEPPLSLLSRRELEVLCLVTEGLGDKQIAEVLHLSVRTIEGHTARIRGKLRLQSRSELIRYGFRRQLASP